MTNKRFSLTELTDAVAPTRRRHRALIDAAVAWHATRGRGLDPDRLGLICAAADRTWDDDVTPTRWTRTGVHHVLRCDALNWCSAQRCPVPEDLPRTMWAWFDFLHATGRLDAGSDPVAELRKPLMCNGALDQDGQPLPPDAERTVPCECFLPYRETVELLGELVARSERSGDDPLDLLRRAVGWPGDGRADLGLFDDGPGGDGPWPDGTWSDGTWSDGPGPDGRRPDGPRPGDATGEG